MSSGDRNESAPALADQVRAWNEWNASHREHGQARISLEQAAVVEDWLRHRHPGGGLRILEVGCGAGWMSERLSAFGTVTGVDLADEVLDRARLRVPQVEFVAGDVLTVPLPGAPFDVIVTLETLAHVPDQAAFVRRAAELLRPGGELLLATQNRPVLERSLEHLPNQGWYRHWVDRHELEALLAPAFDLVELRSITPTYFTGPLHLLNSARVETLAHRVGLGALHRRVKRFQEDRDLGWTLMALGTRRAGPAAVTRPGHGPG